MSSLALQTPHIRASGVSITLRERSLVSQLDLVIEPGQFLAVAGPSGCGKTTLLQVLAGFMDPSSGDVRWISTSGVQSNAAAYRQQTGFVYQHLRLARQLDALTNVACGSLGRQRFWQTWAGFDRTCREKAYHELQSLGLGPAAYKLVDQLSGGERQRVAIARTLLQEPVVLFADEPVANLDRANAQRVLARLRLEANLRGRTVIAVLHDDTQIGLFADRVLRWDGGSPSLWKVETLRERGRHEVAG